jgi:hypothetical protein
MEQREKRRRIIWIVLGVLALVIGWFVYLGYCFSDMPGMEVVYYDFRSAPSPDGRYTATSYSGDAGATTDFGTYVNLRVASEKLNANPDTPVILVVRGEQRIKLKWTSPTQLSVHYHPYKIYHQETRWRDVIITYIADERIESR